MPLPPPDVQLGPPVGRAGLSGPPVHGRLDAVLDAGGVAQCVCEAAVRLRTARSAFTAHLLALFAGEIGPLQHDDELLGLLAASTEENVVAVLHVLEHGIDPATLGAPAAAVQYARRLAQRGTPLSALLRSYRLGQAQFLEECLHTVADVAAGDPVVLGGASLLVTQVVNAYIDRVCELVVGAYEAEREAWQSTRPALRAARVRALLTSDRLDVAAAESTLGYRLRQDHVALVLWLDTEDPGGGDDLLRLERLANALALELGDRQPLFVPTDEAGANVWLRAPTTPVDPVALGRILHESALPAQLAVGNPGPGVAGFRSSHRQAVQARAVALAAAGTRRVTTFAEAGPVALLCSDLAATRSWVADTLGALATDDEGSDRLRRTLQIFLGAGGSYTAAAETLSMHRNSVQYRVQKAEQLRGRALREDRLDVELALRVCDLLGKAVLLPAR
ncbi:MAG: hypothetical protein JWN08_1871 [Frankiales bacterium]|nr:hypothetical protein [Frankiales bacterium]